MKHKTIISIDPGQKGAFTVLGPDGLDIWDLKDCYDQTTGFNSLDPLKFNQMVDLAIPANCGQVDVFCEESLLVHGNGIKTARSVFDARGVLRTVLALRGYGMQFIPPKTWKKHFGLLKSDKTASVSKAIELLPEYADFFQKQYRGRTIDLDGRAEAALIALYAKTKNT